MVTPTQHNPAPPGPSPGNPALLSEIREAARTSRHIRQAAIGQRDRLRAEIRRACRCPLPACRGVTRNELEALTGIPLASITLRVKEFLDEGTIYRGHPRDSAITGVSNETLHLAHRPEPTLEKWFA